MHLGIGAMGHFYTEQIRCAEKNHLLACSTGY